MNGGAAAKTKKGYKGKKKNNDDQLKVVYISSPMKVKTSASKFRSLVQELTGKNSDISQYMDDYSNVYEESRDDHVYREIDCGRGDAKETSDEQYQTHDSSLSRDDTCTSSEGATLTDNVFTSQIREQFAGIFSMNDSFYDPSQLDVLGSFDELLS